MNIAHKSCSECFSSSYAESRRKFLAAAKACDADFASATHPMQGPSGEPLSMDLAYVGPQDAKNVLAVFCGTHGVEGFAGSAIQTKYLEKIFQSGQTSNTGVLMIHGVNPYGMAFLRRATEDNIDLNRNFRDHSLPAPYNAEYAHLSNVIAPEKFGRLHEFFAWNKLRLTRILRGEDALRTAVTSGQYHFPKGLFYGGTAESWSSKTLLRLLSGAIERAENIIVVDVHTGLGDYGDAEILVNSSRGSEEFEAALKIWSDRNVKSTLSEGAVSVHLEASLKLALQSRFPDKNLTAVSLEYGTLPRVEMLKALRFENWDHFYGSGSKDPSVASKRALLDAFYPNDPAWRRRILESGLDVLDQAAAYLD